LRNYLNTIFHTLALLVKHGAPSHIIAFGDALGDNLLLTVLTRELYDRGFKKIWIKSNHKELFEHNPHIVHVLPFNALLSSTVLRFYGVKKVFPKYTIYDESEDRDEVPDKHIVLKMADCVRLFGPILVKPLLILTQEERCAAEWAKGKIIITTTTTAAFVPMSNKEWPVEKYQQVVNHFKHNYQFIQLGSLTDNPLSGVTDMRGKTDIRQTAAILSHALLLISHVGFIMHLARSVDCRTVIIYGGREKPDQSGYACFENIYSAIECSPCWLHNTCHYDKKCMQIISAQMVQDAVLKQIKLLGTPLKIDTRIN